MPPQCVQHLLLAKSSCGQKWRCRAKAAQAPGFGGAGRLQRAPHWAATVGRPKRREMGKSVAGLSIAHSTSLRVSGGSDGVRGQLGAAGQRAKKGGCGEVLRPTE